MYLYLVRYFPYLIPNIAYVAFTDIQGEYLELSEQIQQSAVTVPALPANTLLEPGYSCISMNEVICFKDFKKINHQLRLVGWQ